MRITLTQSVIDTELRCPEGRRKIEYSDSDGVKGMFVECRSGCDDHTYYVRYRDPAGTTRLVRLGRTSQISLADARREARKKKAEITLGADPHAAKMARKQVLTLDQFWTEHYLPQARQSKRSWRRDEQLYRIRIKPVFGQRRLTEISRLQLEQFQTKLAEEGLAQASCDLHAKLLRTMLARAERYGLIKESPARRLKLFNPDNRVEHYLNDDQLAKLLDVLRSDSKPARLSNRHVHALDGGQVGRGHGGSLGRH
jgi:hypothetical protein